MMGLLLVLTISLTGCGDKKKKGDTDVESGATKGWQPGKPKPPATPDNAPSGN